MLQGLQISFTGLYVASMCSCVCSRSWLTDLGSWLEMWWWIRKASWWSCRNPVSFDVDQWWSGTVCDYDPVPGRHGTKTFFLNKAGALLWYIRRKEASECYSRFNIIWNKTNSNWHTLPERTETNTGTQNNSETNTTWKEKIFMGNPAVHGFMQIYNAAMHHEMVPGPNRTSNF